MKWRKLGQVFCPNRNFEWMHSHASYPWLEKSTEKDLHVYFSTRNKVNISSIGRVRLDMEKLAITEIENKPVIEKGEIGCFDDSGVTISCIQKIGQRKFLYYLGWNILTTVPWRNTIGLAIEENPNSGFNRFSKAPIIGIHHYDPFTLTYPFVMFDEGKYKMWYGSSLYWGPKVFDTQHVIKYATSEDGINWERNNHICINVNYPNEFAIVKPFVLKEGGIYKMWYSYRTKNYNLGYAISSDGLNWKRKDDEVGIGVSTTGWDSEMICYPFIFDYNGDRYMLYNGNGYGKTGFGIAVLEK